MSSGLGLKFGGRLHTGFGDAGGILDPRCGLDLRSMVNPKVAPKSDSRKTWVRITIKRHISGRTSRFPQNQSPCLMLRVAFVKSRRVQLIYDRGPGHQLHVVAEGIFDTEHSIPRVA